MKKSIYIITISFLIFSLSLSADVTESSDICNNEKFTKCISINKNKCISAKLNSEATCLKKYPINLDESQEKSIKTAKNYGQCSMNNFIANLDTNKNKFEKCLSSSNYQKHVEKIMKNKNNGN